MAQDERKFSVDHRLGIRDNSSQRTADRDLPAYPDDDMPEVTRLGDKAKVPADGHGCLGCAHTCIGPAVEGSEDVFVNGRPAERLSDPGVHASCCGPNTWKIAQGSSTVNVNGKPVARKGDMTQHCGGIGKLEEGSSDVYAGGAPTAAPKPAAPAAASEKKFATAEEAAVDAMQKANPKSVAEGREYGGWIQKNADGTYSAHPATKGSKDGLSNMPAKGSNDVAWWHTHGAADPGYDNENFSGMTGDKGYSKQTNSVGYLATPSGAIKKYDPATNTVTTLKQKAPPK